jgi:hypothetical protein
LATSTAAISRSIDEGSLCGRLPVSAKLQLSGLVFGVVIAAIGTDSAYLINGVSLAAVLISLAFLRVAELRPNARAHRAKGSFTEGFRYVWGCPNLKVILVMLFLIGKFGLNFPIFISTMAVGVFHADARGYGLLSTIMAIGTVAGALLGTRREKPQFPLLLIGDAVFGLDCTQTAIAPCHSFFADALVVIGAAALTLTSTTNSLMQLSTEGQSVPIQAASASALWTRAYRVPQACRASQKRPGPLPGRWIWPAASGAGQWLRRYRASRHPLPRLRDMLRSAQPFRSPACRDAACREHTPPASDAARSDMQVVVARRHGCTRLGNWRRRAVGSLKSLTFTARAPAGTDRRCVEKSNPTTTCARRPSALLSCRPRPLIGFLGSHLPTLQGSPRPASLRSSAARLTAADLHGTC